MDKLRALTITAAAVIGALTSTGSANAAGPTADQATRMYNRIAGVPPTPAILNQMASAICGGTCAAGAAGAAPGSAGLLQAAQIATNAPTF